MNKKQRIAKTFDFIKYKNNISTKKVLKEMSQYGASPVTTRRDLRELEEKNLIKLTYGKIEILSDDENCLQESNENKVLNIESKQTIAAKLMHMIDHEDTIFVSSGTTAELFIANIRKDVRLLVTNGINVFYRAIKNSFIKEKILIGGFYNARTHSVVGAMAEDQIKNLYFEKIFISFDHLSDEQIIYSDDYQETHLLQLVIVNAKQKNLMCDSSKLHATGFCKIGCLKEFDYLVHDDMLEESDKKLLSQSVTLI